MCGVKIRLMHAAVIGPFIVWAAQNNKTGLLTALGIAVIATHLTLMSRDGQLTQLVNQRNELGYHRMRPLEGFGPYAKCSRCSGSR